MPPTTPAGGRIRWGWTLAAAALAAIGFLALVASPAQAQTGFSTVCYFNSGPRAGTNFDYARMGLTPLPVGSFCQDGAGSTGVVVAGTGGASRMPATPPLAPAPSGGASRMPAAPLLAPSPSGGAPAPQPLAAPIVPFSRPPAAADGAPPAAHSPPPPPAPRPVTFAGGSVRKAVVTPADPLPQPGFGLYVYILPEREVDVSIQRGIEEFHRCLDPAAAGEARKTIALMILPTRGPAAPEVDTALAHDLVRTAIADERIDTREVYVVAANSPLIRGFRADPRALTVITLGRIAPTFVGTWLAGLQGLIEQGRIESPATLALRVRSLLVEVNAVGSLIGITPAGAAPYKCL